MYKKLLIVAGIIVVAICFVFLLQIQPQPQQTLSHKLQVATSFYPLYFFASQIAGDKAYVFTITPAGAEPHDYELTTQDIAKINQSAMLVLNGGALEAWGDKLKDQLQGTSVYVVTAGVGLANQHISENGQTIQDPHVWLSPLLAKKEVAVIEKGFEKVDPQEASYFQANAKRLNEQLDQLDQEYKQGLQQCTLKSFVTSHAAFGYLAKAYGIQQIAISGVSPDEEPSPQKLAEITDLVKQEHISVIFFESLVNPKLSETIAQETGAKAQVLDPIEGISDNDLKVGHTYLTVMKANLVALESALQCHN